MEDKKTQAAKVLDYMKTNGSIDTVKAFNDLHVTRLAAVIYELDSIVNIKRGWKYTYDERGKVVTKIMEYWL